MPHLSPDYRRNSHRTRECRAYKEQQDHLAQVSLRLQQWTSARLGSARKVLWEIFLDELTGVTVIFAPVMPQQEQALEYWPLFSHFEAYHGMECADDEAALDVD